MTTIRAVRTDELDTLYPLWQEQVNVLAQSAGRPATAQPAEWHAAMLALLDDPRAICLAAQDEPQPALLGFVVATEAGIGLLPSQDGRWGIISEMVIDMHRYQAGLARALVEAVRAAFEQRGIGRVIALSPRHAVVSQAFWRSFGAKPAIDGFLLP